MKKITLILLAVLTAGLVFAETKSTLRADITRLQKGEDIRLPQGQLFVGGTDNEAMPVVMAGDFTWAFANGTGTLSIAADSVGSAEIAANAVAASEIAAGAVGTSEISDGAVAIADMATATRGARVATMSSTTETFGELKRTVITITNCVETATDGDDEGESQSVYTFPEGYITILGAMIDGGITNDVKCGNYVVSVGTVAAADDATLTSTEVTIIPSTAIAGGGTATRKAFQAGMPPTILAVNNTAGAAGVFLNFGIADAQITAPSTAWTVDRTTVLEIWWLSTYDLN
jgi:hypothetical protein